MSSSSRLLSVDALRGFDMFWILGGELLFAALYHLTGQPLWQRLDMQVHHSPWHGFTAYDGIFPLFIFLAGTALGLGSEAVAGQPFAARRRLYLMALKRLALLLVFGVLYNHGWGSGLPAEWGEVRYASVLGRIGLAWFVAAMLVWHCQPRVWLGVALTILLGYWALLAGHLDNPALTPNAWVDAHFLPGIHYHQMPADPEGLLSTLPAVVNALLGVMAGRLLKGVLPPWQKAARLAAMGFGLLLLGYLWALVLPLNKTLWTSSFVLVTSGWSALLLALFYALIDVLRLRWLGWFFAVIGANAIVIYLASSLVDWRYIANSLLGQWIAALSPAAQPLAAALALLAVQWLVLAWLYRRQIFIKV
ncbi:transmembrane glucosamine N-acetyltransferase NagX [Gallaecimonas pentaromativorans]|uniref:Putative acyltransferase n=1 Tax=Gallaecimonas pentaromativorans TaxID=584787 RepID=A0A3N1P5L2_9GAMM|nr:putative acyltransferase [Gallaecimonas pentaromativorans]